MQHGTLSTADWVAVTAAAAMRPHQMNVEGLSPVAERILRLLISNYGHPLRVEHLETPVRQTDPAVRAEAIQDALRALTDRGLVAVVAAPAAGHDACGTVAGAPDAGKPRPAPPRQTPPPRNGIAVEAEAVYRQYQQQPTPETVQELIALVPVLVAEVNEAQRWAATARGHREALAERNSALRDLIGKVRDWVGGHGDGEIDAWGLRELLAQHSPTASAPAPPVTLRCKRSGCTAEVTFDRNDPALCGPGAAFAASRLAGWTYTDDRGWRCPPHDE